MQTSFGLWVWERVIKPVLDENLRLNPVEINMMSTVLSQSNITEWQDNRLKGSAKKVKTPRSKRKGDTKANPQVVSSHRPITMSFGNVKTDSSSDNPKSTATKDDGKKKGSSLGGDEWPR